MKAINQSVICYSETSELVNLLAAKEKKIKHQQVLILSFSKEQILFWTTLQT